MRIKWHLVDLVRENGLLPGTLPDLSWVSVLGGPSLTDPSACFLFLHSLYQDLALP